MSLRCKLVHIDTDVFKLVYNLLVFYGWELHRLKAVDELTNILIHTHLGGG